MKLRNFILHLLCIVAVTTFVIANNIPDNEQNTSDYKTTISDVKFKDSKCITFNTCEGEAFYILYDDSVKNTEAAERTFEYLSDNDIEVQVFVTDKISSLLSIESYTRQEVIEIRDDQTVYFSMDDHVAGQKMDLVVFGSILLIWIFFFAAYCVAMLRCDGGFEKEKKKKIKAQVKRVNKIKKRFTPDEMEETLKQKELERDLNKTHVVLKISKAYIVIFAIGIVFFGAMLAGGLWAANGNYDTETLICSAFFGVFVLFCFYGILEVLVSRIDIYHHENFFLFRNAFFRTYKIFYSDCVSYKTGYNLFALKTNNRTFYLANEYEKMDLLMSKLSNHKVKRIPKSKPKLTKRQVSYISFGIVGLLFCGLIVGKLFFDW